MSSPKEQASVPAPAVTNGPGHSLPYRLYLRLTTWLLRQAVAAITGSGHLFDKTISVATLGLGEGHVKVAVCLPRGPASDRAPIPLLLVAEGGGFVLGQPTDGEHIDRPLSDKVGTAVISVDYAKSPRYPFPHALLQLYGVLKWTLSPAGEEALGVKLDPSRVAIMGNSAGGNLAAALTLLLSFTAGPCAKFRRGLPATFSQAGEVLVCPSTACNRPYLERYEACDLEAMALSLPVWAATLMEASYLPPCVDKNQIFVAPINAEVELLMSLHPPPTLCLTAGKDCLKVEAEAYVEKLRQAGVRVTQHEYPEAIHSFSHYRENSKSCRKEDVEDCWERVAEFLRDIFLSEAARR